MVEDSISFRLARKIAGFLGLQLYPQVQAEPTSPDDPTPRAVPDANQAAPVTHPWEEIFRLGYSRQRKYQEYENMDESDIAVQMDAIINSSLVSDDGTFHGFRVNTGAKYGTVIQDLVERVDLMWYIREVLRDTLKFGDEFQEIVIDDDFNIVRLQSAPCPQMYVNVDAHNRVLGGTGKYTNHAKDVFGNKAEVTLPRAYHQLNGSMQVVAAWYPWEMQHLKWRTSTKKTYSVGSYLEPMRRPWHSLRMMEQGMVVARLMRAYPKNIHYLDETDKDPEAAQKDLDAYVDAVTKKKTSGDNMLERSLEVNEDLFVGTGYIEDGTGEMHPKMTKIETQDPSVRGLANIGDVEYHRQKLFPYISSEVVGISTDKEDLSLQDIASSRLFQYCQVGILERQLLWPLFRLQLLLKGYKPVRTDIEIEWPEVVVRNSWRFSDGFFRRAMGWRNHVEIGTASRHDVARDELGKNDTEWEQTKEEVEDEMANMPVIPQGSQAAQTSQGNRSA